MTPRSSCGRARTSTTRRRSCTCCAARTGRCCSTPALSPKVVARERRSTACSASGDRITGLSSRTRTGMATTWRATASSRRGRALRVTGSPGHHDAAITVHDPRTGFLLTGDTVYPGRLYVSDMPAFVASLDRMAEFAAAHPVTHVLGCHIEMTRRRGRDYPLGCLYQPDEPPLQMTVARLGAVRDAAHAVADRPGAHGFGDFVIYNGPCERAMARQKVRGAISRARRRAMMILKPAHISVSQGLISWCGRDNDVRHRVERSVSVRWPGLRRVR